MIPSYPFSWLRRTSWSTALLTVTAISVLACSSDEDTRTSARKVVGSDGGQLTIGVASLDVPEGALGEPSELEMISHGTIGAAGLADPPSGAQPRSHVLGLKPHGLQFEKPVQVELDYEGSDGASLVLGRLDDDQDDTWESVPGGQFDSGVAKFSTNGFSYYVVFEDPEGVLGREPDGTGGAMGMGGAGASDGAGGSDTGGTGGDPETGGTGGEVTTGGTGGGAGGGLSSPLTLGSYSNGGDFAGTVMAVTGGDAKLTSATAPGVNPNCATADIPAGGSLTLKAELTSGEQLMPMSLDEYIRYGLSSGSYTGLLEVIVGDGTNDYFFEVNGPAMGNEYLTNWSQYGGYDLQPLTFIEFTIPGPEAGELQGQELCVTKIFN